MNELNKPSKARRIMKKYYYYKFRSVTQTICLRYLGYSGFRWKLLHLRKLGENKLAPLLKINAGLFFAKKNWNIYILHQVCNKIAILVQCKKTRFFAKIIIWVFVSSNFDRFSFFFETWVRLRLLAQSSLNKTQ
jgi:hypothetical protein